MLEKLREQDLYGKTSKCELHYSQIQYFGQGITKIGTQVDESKITPTRHWEPSQSVTQAQRYFVLCNYYRRFLKSSATVAAPLSSLTQKRRFFQWKAVQQKFFQQLKGRPSHSSVFQCTDSSLPYKL